MKLSSYMCVRMNPSIWFFTHLFSEKENLNKNYFKECIHTRKKIEKLKATLGM